MLYDGAALARRGCVYVSVNYLFLRDLVMALQWVHDNIGAFGGDPDNVTIFGESAGAQAVATLLAVPAAKGLFHQVISESPAAGMVRSADIAEQFAHRFAGLLDAGSQDGAATVMQASPRRLVDALDELIAHGNEDMLGAFPAGPSYGDDYLPLDPVDAMARGAAHTVPLIVGNNAEEAKLFTRFLKLLPITEPMIEAMLASAGADT